ncbi:MAG: VWA domain-containing protein [Bacteroidales bacterium]|nr:VWA domain-containing protein [Bacteroidales bacterium]MBR3426907.1 VWA domain-containing protein [Bacteroidales bacterium]MBR5377707.1 VWA domain-containing protein [Bacteroidales bacterium]
MEFANPKLLWLLLLVPLAILWYVVRHKKQEASVRFSDLSGLAKLPKSWKPYLRHLLFALKLAALALLIVALARPQSSSTNSTSNIEGIDIVMAMDVSGSMLARDLKPDRLTAAKRVASDFVNDRPGDRMGLVIFSGESFTQVPLTTDHGVMLNMLAEMKNGLIDDGTAIGDGLATAISRLKDSEAISKVVILLTDGMNNAGSVDPYTAAEMAKLFGIRVYTIGVGSYGTAPYPVQTPFGTQIQQMRVEIDEKLLTTIANSTGGRYYRATSNQKLDEIYTEIDKLERSKIEVTEFRRLHEEFYPLVAWALALLLLEFLLRKTIFRTITD